ncbi:MAG: lipopolysaccharide heptosyltransferase II [Candidatus Adiutrix sp.]|jgi:lipopolysaccharide heptosyltransferase I|nr:lipopolysaccharide heptosyltransferase II [Candidatus Adiutrix sp.]
MPDIDKLLIIKMSAVGDVVMTLPALEALRHKYPAARIDWLVEPAAAGLLHGHPQLDRVIISPRRELSRLAKAGRLLRAHRLYRAFKEDLRSVEYDVVLDLQGLLKSGLMVRLARGRRKVGFDLTREKSYKFLSEKMPPYDPDRHAVLRYLDAAAYLGAERPAPWPEAYYTPPPQAAREAEELLARRVHGPFVIFNPGAKWVTKRWPLPHWLDLAEKVLRSTELEIAVTGGPEDAEWGEAIVRAVPEISVNFCGQTSLPALAHIMTRAEAVVTADTGPMHLAAAVGAGGLALFGPTRPWRTGPFGGHFEVLTPELDCLGCLRKNCGQPCLERLEPSTVFSNLMGYLKKRGRADA